MMTPIKIKSKDNWPDSQETAPRTSDRDHTQGTKQKMIRLMKENVQLKCKQKTLSARIQSLQYSEQKLKREVDSFLVKIKCATLGQARQVFMNLSSKQPHQNNLSILSDLMRSIQTNISCANVSNQTNKFYSQIIDRKFRELEVKYDKEIGQLQKQNKRLLKQNLELKQNNNKIEDANLMLRKQLNKSIEKFQNIEALVDQKLNFYLEKIKQYEDIIKKQKHDPHEFSFGLDSFQCEPSSDYHRNQPKRSEQETKFFQKQQYGCENREDREKKRGEVEQDLSGQCYRASIEGLLQQNKRLKKSFQALYRLKVGEQLPGELLKEINIMNSIIELNENLQNNQGN